MVVMRYKNKSTHANINALLQILQNQITKRLILFASPEAKTADMCNDDGPEINLPLVVALAEIEIPAIDTLYVIFDGLFLTAVRRPRYLEVRNLLDAGIKSEKTYFSLSRAPFTSRLKPEDAAKTLLNTGSSILLDIHSRPDYFKLLSSISEEEYP